MRLWKLHLANIQITNLPIDVSEKCEDLHNEMNPASSEFQKLNINFGQTLPAAGLNEARRKYLRDSIWPFSRLGNQDSFDAMLE